MKKIPTTHEAFDFSKEITSPEEYKKLEIELIWKTRRLAENMWKHQIDTEACQNILNGVKQIHTQRNPQGEMIGLFKSVTEKLDKELTTLIRQEDARMKFEEQCESSKIAMNLFKKLELYLGVKGRDSNTCWRE